MRTGETGEGEVRTTQTARTDLTIMARHGSHFSQLHNLLDIWEIVFPVQLEEIFKKQFFSTRPGVVDVPTLLSLVGGDSAKL